MAGYSNHVKSRVLFSLLSAVLAPVALGFGTALAAPSKITFWHYLGQETGSSVLDQLAMDFNKSQTKYAIDPQYIGDFKTIQIKVTAALRAGGLPGMAMVDNAFFSTLALTKPAVLENMNDQIASLPKGTTQDFFPTFWDNGNVSGARLGLPWASSTLLLFYNADAFRAKGLTPPKSWDEFATAAKALTNRTSKGAIFFTDAWIFGSMVSSRGGNLLGSDNLPTFDEATTISTLQFIKDLTPKYAIIRTFGQANFAVIDFLRTKAFMVVVPTSAYPFLPSSAPFQVGAVALPGKTIAGETQLVTFKNNSGDQNKGAFEFWQYLVKPENLAKFDKQSYYLPVRKSAVKLLGDFANNAVMKAGLEALDRSYNLPHLIDFQDWRAILEGQLERCLIGGADAKASMLEAQRLSVKK
jgi:ABC-type glycerol-3-phosphate transport system substrate-binding protein